MAMQNRRRPKYQGKGSKDKDTFQHKDDGTKKTKYNDPSWYIREGQLAKDVASLSFNNALGAIYSIDPDNVGGSYPLVGANLEVPGIMAIYTIPAVGAPIDGADPINIAAKNLYSFVRHMNSGHANYDSPDLMLYVMAMDSLYAYIAYLQRAYGVARLYSQRNRYIGDALMMAMGINPSNIRANLANFRAYINMLIVKASVFCTPTTMTLFKRHMWMYSGIYKDEDIDKSQMFLYVPAYLWKYAEMDGAGYLDPMEITCSLSNNAVVQKFVNMDLGQLINIGDQLVGALQASEDINIMSGDILKAYGQNIWKLELIPDEYFVMPVYSDEVLDQIHNSDFAGNRPRNVLDLNDVTQCNTGSIERFKLVQNSGLGAGELMFRPQFSGGYHLSFEKLLDMCENEPTPERVIVATRNVLHGVSNVGEAGIPITTIDSCGSDICLFAAVFAYTNGALSYTNMYVSPNPSQSSLLTPLTVFDKAPIAPLVATTGGTSTYTKAVGEIGNFTIIDKDDTDKIHQSAIMSMLGVPV